MPGFALHRYSAFLTAWIVFLLAAGAMVTGTGSGLAVPDWPLSFGKFFPEMTGGVFYEHGHRMVAGVAAILTFVLAFLLGRMESRPWVRRIGYLAAGAVILQACLGGLTVLMKLPPAVSVMHACLAQLFFSLVVLVTVVTSPGWARPATPLAKDGLLVPLCFGLNLLFFLQLVAGATTRHLGAGLAIPDFPTVYGGWLPPAFTLPVTVHFIHRVGAFTIVGLLALLVSRVLKRHYGHFGVTVSVGILAGLVSMQFLLGALVIWTRRPIPLTTTHLVVGALCLAASFVVTAQVFRGRRA